MSDSLKSPYKAATAIFFYVLVLLLFVPIRTPLYIYDEGFAVFNATRLLNGELPYQDFWAVYPPGQLYILAGVYKLFGISLLASRVYDTLVRIAVVVGCFLVARQVTSKFLSYLTVFVAALVMASVGFYAYAVYPALALGVFALWCTIKFVETGRQQWLILAGVLVGISSFFRWDIGLYGIIGLGAAVFLHRLVASWQGGQPFLQVVWSGVKTAAGLLLPAAGMFLALYGLVSLNSGLSYVWDQVFWFPATKLHEVRALAYPKLIPGLSGLSDIWSYYSPYMDWLRFYLPLAVYAFTFAFYGYLILVRRIQLDTRHFGMLAAALFGLLAFAQALSRYDYIHALPTGLFALLVIVGLVSQVRRPPAAAVYLRTGLIILLPAILCVYFFSTLDSFNRTLDQFPPWNCYSPLPRASCAYVGENQLRTVDYIQANTQVDEPIYVGNQRHDMIFISDVGFYFLAGRPSATRYSELHPGVATTRPVQLEIINELDTKQVPLLVLVDIWLSQEPNGSAQSSGVTDLDDYIHDKYRQITQFGEYQIWQRADR